MDKDENVMTICPFCGSPMGWESDAMSEECGYKKRGKVVMFFTCPNCGANGEFVENLETEENEQNKSF